MVAGDRRFAEVDFRIRITGGLKIVAQVASAFKEQVIVHSAFLVDRHQPFNAAFGYFRVRRL